MSIDPTSLEWKRGYRDGFLDTLDPDTHTKNYIDGYIAGCAEQDAPEAMIEPALWAERLARMEGREHEH